MDSFLSRDGVPDTWDFIFAVYFAIFFAAARFFFDKFVFRGLATWLSNKGSNQVKLNEATLGKIVKCSESMWKLTYYATVEACVLRMTFYEPWFRDTQEYFRGWPNHELKLPIKLYYMCQCGFYLYSIAALLTWETRRKDFAVMMSHHVITVILIGYSYISRFFRSGSIVLALHDASDVFMEAAKVFKYSEKELAASVFFGFFAVSWLALRLVYFPFWVIKTSSYDMGNYLKLSEPYPRSLYYVFNTMLLMLLVFHIYWWILICSMIMRQLENKGKVGEDIRSDSDEDE
ncbi:Ceramide synthase loh2 [Dionaea muscipula]